MKYFSLGGLLIEFKLCLIKNNIIRLISFSSPYRDSSLLEYTSSIVLNINSIFDPCSNSTSISNDITVFVTTSDHNLNPLWEVIHILFLLNIQRSWILNLENQFSIQKMDFNKRFDVIFQFDYVSNIILSQMILKIEDYSLLLILITILFSSLTSSFYDFNVLIISLSKHHESQKNKVLQEKTFCRR